MIAEEVKARCVAAYGDQAVRWLVGESLHPGGLALTDQLLESLQLTRESTLLDVACGTGASSRRAFETDGCSVVGTDLSTAMVGDAVATSPNERVRFLVADAEGLPLADESVDAVLCECALCLFPDPLRALGEAVRVLRPGGRIAVSDMTADTVRLPGSLLTVAGRVACLGAARSLA
ncbi:MAG: class I SAM-dependent methyltransferase, partial [Solirubrobacterales bacterium]